MVIENLKKLSKLLNSIIAKGFFYVVIFVFLFFLLYIVKTLAGIDFFSDMHVDDFMSFMYYIIELGFNFLFH